MGIYNEIPESVGSEGNLDNFPTLETYRKAADLIENSGLNYTIIRPGWFINGPVDYDLTQKGEPFGGHDVSISSIADLVVNIIEKPAYCLNQSVGINKK